MPSQASVLGIRVDAKAVIGVAVFAAVGVLLATYPVEVLGAAAALFSLTGILRVARGRLEFWQILVLVTLAAYGILNYGFDNLAVGLGGIQIPVGELLMLLALGMVILGGRSRSLSQFLLDPPVLCLLLLLLLALIHLVVDLPRHGLYALRDSSIFCEAVFLPLGLLWANRKRDTPLLLKWLLFVFFTNLIYSFTFPWAEQLQSWSPGFGVFHPVPLFGNYQDNALYLLCGALFCILLGHQVVRWPRWFLLALAVAQLCGLAILQVRSMYAGIAAVLLLLLFLWEAREMAQFASILALSLGTLCVLVLLVSLLGLRLRGRSGPVDFSFLEKHVRTVLSLNDARTRMAEDTDRASWYEQVWRRTRSSKVTLIVGEGFGEPLIDFKNEEGIPVRQPHNSSLSVLARLGLVGLLVWLVFLVSVTRRFVHAIRRRVEADDGVHQLVLWLFFFFVLAMIQTSVQPALEFSHGAIPFYFLVGFALGVMRWQVEGSATGSSPLSRVPASSR